MVTIADARAVVQSAVREDVVLLRSREWPLVQVNHLRSERQYPPFEPPEGYYEALALVVTTDVVAKEREDTLACLIAGARRGCVVFVPEAHEARKRARRLLATVGGDRGF